MPDSKAAWLALGDQIFAHVRDEARGLISEINPDLAMADIAEQVVRLSDLVNGDDEGAKAYIVLVHVATLIEAARMMRELKELKK